MTSNDVTIVTSDLATIFWKNSWLLTLRLYIVHGFFNYINLYGMATADCFENLTVIKVAYFKSKLKYPMHFLKNLTYFLIKIFLKLFECENDPYKLTLTLV